MTRALKRIQKEKEKFDKDGIGEGLSLTVLSDLEWSVTFTMAGGSVFDGESFSLKIIFDEKGYPFDAPIVVFEQPSPEHEHVYTNGHICLNILDSDWTPALTVINVCLSIKSMLASAKSKGRPPDNARYVSKGVANPKDTSWYFHDDTV